MHWSRSWSCNDPLADHTLITWLIMQWSRGWSSTDHVADHAMITWLIIHWSRGWSCNDHVADHALITWGIMNWRSAEWTLATAARTDSRCTAEKIFFKSANPRIWHSHISAYILRKPLFKKSHAPQHSLQHYLQEPRHRPRKMSTERLKLSKDLVLTDNGLLFSNEKPPLKLWIIPLVAIEMDAGGSHSKPNQPGEDKSIWCPF